MHILIEKKSLPMAENTFEQWHGSSLPAPVTLVGATGSVLDDAWNLVAAGAMPVWGSVLAQSQSAGRGQTRRQWHSPAGNVYAAWRLPMEGVFLSTAAAPALSALILMALQTLGVSLRLKWPNDLVLTDGMHKVGGILIEEKQGVLIAGIGINLCEAAPESFLRKNHALSAGLLPPVKGLENGLTVLNNSEFCTENAAAQRLWIHLVSHMYFCYKKKLLADASWKDFAENFLLWKGQFVELDDGHECVRGVLQGLGSQGEICIAHSGQVQQCTSGSLRLGK